MVPGSSRRAARSDRTAARAARRRLRIRQHPEGKIKQPSEAQVHSREDLYDYFANLQENPCLRGAEYTWKSGTVAILLVRRFGFLRLCDLYATFFLVHALTCYRSAPPAQQDQAQVGGHRRVGKPLKWRDTPSPVEGFGVTDGAHLSQF